MLRKLLRRGLLGALGREFERGVTQTLMAHQSVGDIADAPDGSRGWDVDTGPEVYQLDGVKSWTVQDDFLAERLGLGSNHEAEAHVAKSLSKVDPGLHQRLEFDSELSSFFAYAQSHEDALALKAFLEVLKAP